MKIFFYKRVIRLGIKSLWQHKLRSFLTLLGIIFGVCSVIAMLAIGEGASQEAQDQIRKLGSQNIIIESVKPPEEVKPERTTTWSIQYGLTYDDAERIRTTIPGVEIEVPMKILSKLIRFRDRAIEGEVVCTVPRYNQIANMRIVQGRYFTELEAGNIANVCVVDQATAEKLFWMEEPLGQTIKAGRNCFRIIGIAENMSARLSKKNTGESGGAGYNIFIPLTAAQARFGELLIRRRSGSFESERVELHKIITRVDDINAVEDRALAIKQVLKTFHKKEDYTITVPFELLRQARRTKQIFSIVLGSIAAISLLVGGIGIMNIMLATVTERTREIGVRRALGAKRKDIITQFLSETILLSGTGGIVGILIGVTLPMLISAIAGMKTIVTWWSLLLSFSISVAVGIIFGIYPARQAAQMDPIEALRHE